MTPAGTNLLLAHADAAPAPADVVTKSLRFNGGDSPILTRTPSSSGSQRIFTFSTWVKRSALTSTGYETIWASEASGSNYTILTYYQDGLRFQSHGGGATPTLQSNAVFRDVSAWYHIVLSVDTTQATDTNRVKIYVNGSAITFSSATYPTLDYDLQVNTSSYTNKIGYSAGTGQYFDGYLADAYFIDGTALTPTSFAEEDATTGQWKPKATSGLTFGTNGFHLDFEDDTAIGNDVSGNNNDFTATNLAASDVVNDTPTDNYCVLNPLDKNEDMTLAEGNLELNAVGGGENYDGLRATMGLPLTGKWYWECKTPTVGYVTALGIADGSGSIIDTANAPNKYTVISLGGWIATYNSGTPQYGVNVSPTSGSNWTQATNSSAGSVFMMAVDMDNGSMWWGLDGTWFANSSGTTANPATNAGPQRTGLDDGTTWFPYATEANGSASYPSSKLLFDFGQSGFAHTPPTGFSALSTGNLPTPTIAKGVTYFDVLTYDDGAGAKTFDNGTVSMQPDLVWVKSRGSAYDHKLTDSVRGVTKALESNTTDVEATESTGLTAFGSDGFTVGADTNYSDTTGDGMVAWNWKKSATSGFNIVGWTGDDDGFSGGTQAVAHGLGVAPEMVIAKNRTDEAGGNGNWIVYHKDTTSGDLLKLNTTGAEFTPNSTLIGSIGSTNVSFGNDSLDYEYLNSDNSFGSGTPDTYIGYFFASVEGYSKVGSYEGNDLADGPFVYCGFRPAFVMMKDMDATRNWHCYDNKREGYNANNDALQPNTSNIEQQDADLDFLSNGFKLRRGNFSQNYSSTYIFYAVAESPFKYASAR